MTALFIKEQMPVPTLAYLANVVVGPVDSQRAGAYANVGSEPTGVVEHGGNAAALSHHWLTHA